jgi:uncharacterized protein YcbK (DUF882 family)
MRTVPAASAAARLAPVLALAVTLGAAAPLAHGSATRAADSPLLAEPGSDAAPAALPTPELFGLVNVLLHAMLGDHAPTLVTLYNVNTRETAHFFIPVTGELDDATADEVARFFRCRRTGRSKRMRPGVLALLADVARQYPGHTIEMVSGYRNTGSRTSHHRKGGAIDLRVRGVRTTEVRDYLWANHSEIGVGWYRQQNFIHIDHRPGDPDIAWTQQRRDQPFQYRPGWAYRVRRAAAAVARGAI